MEAPDSISTASSAFSMAVSVARKLERGSLLGQKAEAVANPLRAGENLFVVAFHGCHTGVLPDDLDTVG